jgi:hypothetical protein
MRKSISKLLIIAIISLNISNLSAQTEKYAFIEVENLSNISYESYLQPQINLYSSSIKSDSKLGFYYFGLINEYWGQAYAGLLYNPSDWFSIGVGAGLEVDDNPYRFNLSMFINKNKFSLTQIYEYGGSGFWYNIIADYRIAEQTKMGIVFRRYYGLGINYEHGFKNSPFALILAPLYDYEDENFKFYFALRYTL